MPDPDLRYRARDRWTDPPTPAAERLPSPFRSHLGDTEGALAREAGRLDATLLVVEVMADDRRDFRVNGSLRADARLVHPGVVVTLDGRHGDLRYATDRFASWKDNLRAVALGLEALRKVDRYGISRSGEQYRGWKALPAGTAMGTGLASADARPAEPSMSEDDALDLLLDLAVGCEPEDYPRERAALRRNPTQLRRTIREAKLMAHPDRVGSRLRWNELERALLVLGAT